MDDGHHGYFSPLLAIAIASVLLCSIVAVVRLVTLPSNRAGREAPSSLTFYVTLATLQVAGFVALEFFEGNAPDVIGCGIEALTALVIAAFVFFFISFAERYVAPVVTTYLRRTRNACNAIRRLPADFMQPPLRLSVCAGICRFKRAPPIIG
jgi:drug/metabolite transporter (DMT)-like permease